MVTVELKGIHTVKAKGNVYYYAWRGGPRLDGHPGTAAFMASYNEAIANRMEPESGRFRSIITHYKATEFKKLADSTKRVWSPWIDRISEHFGNLSIAQFNRTDKIRPRIRQWRGQYSDTPRAADTGMQVLSRILSHGVDPMGKLSANPAEGIKHLYSSDRSEIIWTDADIAQVKAECSDEVKWVIDLAAHTGLRVSDLLKLAFVDLHALPARYPHHQGRDLRPARNRRRTWPAEVRGQAGNVGLISAKARAGVARARNQSH